MPFPISSIAVSVFLICGMHYLALNEVVIDLSIYPNLDCVLGSFLRFFITSECCSIALSVIARPSLAPIECGCANIACSNALLASSSLPKSLMHCLCFLGVLHH